MNPQAASKGFRPVRRDQLRRERVHDTHRLKEELAGPAGCPDYGAGRWQWGVRPAGALEVDCAACHRVRDLGEALHHELEFHYNDAENPLRVHWRR